jgi:peptidoglycan/xylan/chitin deacetylase (PgdA/CDA1 family)
MGLKGQVKRLLFAVDPIIAEASSRLNNTEGGTLRAICLHAMKNSAQPSRGVAPGVETDIGELRSFVEILLRRRYQFVTPSDLAQDLDPQGRYLMVTFDDGYFTTSLAVELFKEYGLRMTLFVAPYFMERQISYWSDALYRGFEARRTAPEARGKIERHLRSIPQTERERYLIETFGDDCVELVGDADRPLTARELRNLWSCGHVEVGNHSWTHADLSRASETEIEEELRLTQSYVESVIGIQPKAVAFPYGRYNERVVAVVKRMGFTSALSTENSRHSVASLRNRSFVQIGRFGSWSRKRPFGRHILRMRCGELFSDRVLQASGRPPSTSDVA